jgi:hypothetical protein
MNASGENRTEELSYRTSEQSLDGWEELLAKHPDLSSQRLSLPHL